MRGIQRWRIILVLMAVMVLFWTPGPASAFECVVAAENHANASAIFNAEAAFVGTVVHRSEEVPSLKEYPTKHYDSFRFDVDDAHGNLGDQVDVISDGNYLSQSQSFDVGDRLGMALTREEGYWVPAGGACWPGADPEEFLDVAAGMNDVAPTPFRGTL